MLLMLVWCSLLQLCASGASLVLFFWFGVSSFYKSISRRAGSPPDWGACIFVSWGLVSVQLLSASHKEKASFSPELGAVLFAVQLLYISHMEDAGPLPD